MTNMTSFGALLKKHVDSKGLSLRQFARLAEPEREESSAVAYLSKVINGKRPPPEDRVLLWLKVLDLDASGMTEYLNAARKAHIVTPLARECVKQLEDQIAWLNKSVKVLTSAASEFNKKRMPLREKNAELKVKLAQCEAKLEHQEAPLARKTDAE